MALQVGSKLSLGLEYPTMSVKQDGQPFGLGSLAQGPAAKREKELDRLPLFLGELGLGRFRDAISISTPRNGPRRLPEDD